jgi:uncharacterized protein YbjT (DUF2867 family)
MSLLIVGGTGTLGRQIVREALDQDFKVVCLVRNIRRASFLKEWGASLVYGDLSLPSTLPNAFKGITGVIDASTTRPDDIQSMKELDWYGKVALIKAAQVANVERFVFMSILNADKYPTIPLMKLKTSVENVLEASKLPFTIFRVAGFYQGLINQYAIPVLDKQPVWVSEDSAPVSYIDTRDVAKICLTSLSLSNTVNKSFVLEGPKSYRSSDLIQICEKLSGQTSKVNKVSLILIKLLRQLSNSFEWSWNITDRLAFVEVLASGSQFDNSFEITKEVFSFNEIEFVDLEKYLQEYFETILKRLKDVNYDPSKRRDLTF